MSERDEIYLRRVQNTWQSRQDSAGVITLFLGLVTFCVLLLFVSDPNHKIAGIMAGLMVLLFFSCFRLISSAAKVVEIGNILRPARIHTRIIEAEVIDNAERRA